MVVKIRLSRVGVKNSPSYRIVVADSRDPRDGRFIEQIGFFNSFFIGSERMSIDLDRVGYWVNRGAVLSSRVRSLMREFKNKVENKIG